MADKIKKLLAVLDLLEVEQWAYLVKNNIKSTKFVPSELIHFYLADLAFRLRDEAAKTHYWREARYMVGDKVFGGYHEYRQDHESTWDEEAQPIHWIIAALIAKELMKDVSDKIKCSDCGKEQEADIIKKCGYCGEKVCEDCWSSHWDYRSTCINCED